MSVTDELLEHNLSHAKDFDRAGLKAPPSRGVAIVACMDARLNLYKILGIEEGEAHIIRNAGGVVTDDAIRSLVISQRELGTREVLLIHHTACGMQTFTDDEFRQRLAEDVGIEPPWAAEAFADVEVDVRDSIARVRANPFIPHKDSVRGFVYEVETGRLREVTA